MDIGSIKAISTPVAIASKTERVAPEETAIISASEVDSDVPASREKIEAAVATIQDFAQTVRRDLNFTLEEGSGRVVVKVTDAGSGDVIRQIPSEEALQLAENLSEVRSLLFKAEA
ncbi:flagellar protein FlaG [Pseudomonas sp. TMP25]|uniref:flagellar protein FlaG n=1 Tax=Pseudomonas sp. TMP25 TaxID=3136561 RepID=UPI00310196AD